MNYSDRSYSSIFVIEPGYQKAYEQVNSKRVILRLKRDSLSIAYQKNIPNEIKIELQNKLNGYYAESDSVLLSYVISHPDSYIAFWKFIYLSSVFGYEPIFDEIFE